MIEKLSAKLDSVKSERASSYGSFYSNMIMLQEVKRAIRIIIKPCKSRSSNLDIVQLAGDREFILNMLSLKTVRSINAQGEVYKDCLLDFVNYMSIYANMLYENYKCNAEILCGNEHIKFNDALKRIRVEEGRLHIDNYNCHNDEAILAIVDPILVGDSYSYLKLKAVLQ